MIDRDSTKGKWEILRLYRRAWARHRIYFGFTGIPLHDKTRLDFPVTLFPQSNVLIYRFPHNYHEKIKRGLRNENFLHHSMLTDCLGQTNKIDPTTIIALCLHPIYRTEELSFDLFLRLLCHCFDNLPKSFRYAVAIHNEEFLLPDYFAALRERNVTHVLHHAPGMPSLLEQSMTPHALSTDCSIMIVKDLVEPETTLGIIETIRQCVEEQKELRLYFSIPTKESVVSLLQLMEMMNADLAKLSPVKQRYAA
jgi:hypothetical protein